MSAHIHTYTYIHTHIQNIHMDARKHAWNDGAAANVQGAVANKLALHFSFVRRNQPTFRTSNARTSLYPRPAVLIPLHSPSPLPNIPQNSSKLAQLYNGPLRSCRKIGGKAAVEQSRSRQARRNPSPRMIKVSVHEKRRVNGEQPTPASSPLRNHDSAAPRQHPLICTGAEPIHQVHGPPKPRATESMLRNRIHISAIFPPFSEFVLP